MMVLAMSASSVSESCLTVVSSTSLRGATSADFEPVRACAVAGPHVEQVVEVRVEPREVGAAHRRAVAGPQVVDRVAQDVEQLVVARALAVAEHVVADDVDRHRHAGADLARRCRRRAGSKPPSSPW